MQSVLFAVGQAFTAFDLRSHYPEYHVILCNSEDVAIETLKQLKELQLPVVLFIVEGKDLSFLIQAKNLVPGAKCLVLMEPSSQEPLERVHFKIDAILEIWSPPEDFLFPVIDSLLEQSQEMMIFPLFNDIRVIGHRWSARSHLVKDFLARHAIPFQWVDLEAQPEKPQSILSGDDRATFPLLQFPDGTQLSGPTIAQLAEKLALTMHSEIPFYDLIIVGAGPAGLAAAVYGASEGLLTAVIERDVPGGQAGMSSRIENYLGFPIGLSGADLARRGVAQAARLGAHIISPQEVTGIRIADPYRYVTLADGSEIGCYALLLATGVAYRNLTVPGLDRLTGSGVYYGAAITEASSCKNKRVFVVGGANSAGQAALYLADYAQQVTILVRGESVATSMSSYLLQEIALRDNIDIQTQTEVIGCFGEEHLEQLCLREHVTGGEHTVEASALFIFIGTSPHTQWLPEIIARDQDGFVLAGSEVKAHSWPLDREPLPLESSIPGLFVAGDIRAESMKRVACATGDGALAVSMIHQYLRTIR